LRYLYRGLKLLHRELISTMGVQELIQLMVWHFDQG
jgi:hypothetical protein